MSPGRSTLGHLFYENKLPNGPHRPGHCRYATLDIPAPLPRATTAVP